MRKIASIAFHGRGRAQALAIVGAVALLVSGLLISLPAKPVAGQQLPTFAAVAPQANAHQSQGDLALDVPFQIQFTKPMNEASVESAIAISPEVGLRFLWDATAQTVSVQPDPYWQPYTHYHVTVSTNATDAQGLALATAIDTGFQSGSPTGGTITATRMVGDRASPTTTFQLTFTRPVKYSTVATRLGITPNVDVTLVGDDPTDAESRVYTLTPKAVLQTNTTYVLTFTDGGLDNAGSTLSPVAALIVNTLQTPSVETFTPSSGSTTRDTYQPISIRFTVPMDHASTQAAFSILANGKSIGGPLTWSDDDTVLTFVPNRAFYIGSVVTVRIAASARSSGGLHMAEAESTTFVVGTPRSRTIAYSTRGIPYTPGQSAANAPWAGAEKYTMDLMNCTRTGSWVTPAGQCSTASHHTLPRQPALAQDAGIATRVARPYAIALATNCVLTHTLGGTTTHGRMTAGGYPGSSWGENVASPSSSGAKGMIAVAIFFQGEYSYRGGHYRNIMNRYFHRAGVGVYVVHGCTRVVIDFYS